MSLLFRALAVLMLVAGVALGFRGYELSFLGETGGVASEEWQNGIALLIAAGFALGMSVVMLVIAGRIGRVPPTRWFDVRPGGRNDR